MWDLCGWCGCIQSSWRIQLTVIHILQDERMTMWSNVCDHILNRKLSIWEEFLQPCFNHRVKVRVVPEIAPDWGEWQVISSPHSTWTDTTLSCQLPLLGTKTGCRLSLPWDSFWYSPNRKAILGDRGAYDITFSYITIHSLLLKRYAMAFSFDVVTCAVIWGGPRNWYSFPLLYTREPCLETTSELNS